MYPIFYLHLLYIGYTSSFFTIIQNNYTKVIFYKNESSHLKQIVKSHSVDSTECRRFRVYI